MGFFSWKTADTDESIPNKYSGVRKIFTVYVLCPNGTIIKEENYDGYGRFGGNDIYELIAHWNCPEQCTGILETDRILGINLYYNNVGGVKYPIKIVRNPNLKYKEVGPSPDCEFQGYFYEIDSGELQSEVDDRLPGLFAYELYEAIAATLTEKLVVELKHDLGYDYIPTEKVYYCVTEYLNEIYRISSGNELIPA